MPLFKEMVQHCHLLRVGCTHNLSVDGQRGEAMNSWSPERIMPCSSIYGGFGSGLWGYKALEILCEEMYITFEFLAIKKV